MQILVISDIHANLLALEAVLADAPAYEAVWFLGDLVGYGPHPLECVERVCGLPGLRALTGNHDQAVLGRIDLDYFNHDARFAIQWTRRRMTTEALAFLDSLPAQEQNGEFMLVHGSPRLPVWEYILDASVANENFPLFSSSYCLVGHTHVPVIYHKTFGQCAELAPDYTRLRQLNSPNDKWIINPGSVGQPRDNNPQAAYAMLDTAAGTWQHRRVDYDVASTQHWMREAKLPERLVLRLANGW